MAAQLYAVDLGATTLTDITAGGAEAGTYLLNLVNRSEDLRKVRIAITKTGTAAAKDYIEYDAKMEGGGVLSRHPIALGAAWKVWVYADGIGISATLNGDSK